MRDEGVDPRDITWENESPTYRVYFWHRPKARPPIRDEEMGWHCDERRVLGASDVREVLAWADGEAGGGRAYTLYVEHRRGADLGLILLAGTDPTEGSTRTEMTTL